MAIEQFKPVQVCSSFDNGSFEIGMCIKENVITNEHAQGKAVGEEKLSLERSEKSSTPCYAECLHVEDFSSPPAHKSLQVRSK